MVPTVLKMFSKFKSKKNHFLENTLTQVYIGTISTVESNTLKTKSDL